jgi:hypothetical protein
MEIKDYEICGIPLELLENTYIPSCNGLRDYFVILKQRQNLHSSDMNGYLKFCDNERMLIRTFSIVWVYKVCTTEYSFRIVMQATWNAPQTMDNVQHNGMLSLSWAKNIY